MKLTLHSEWEAHLVKPSQQLAHSLGSKAVMPRVSVEGGISEPQCESVKLCQKGRSFLT